MENSWELINSYIDIPDIVINKTVSKTRNKLVIDFGSGASESQHIEFHAKRITRWDVTGVIQCNQEKMASSIYDIVILNNDDKFVIVFYRVISVMSESEVEELRKMIHSIKHRLDCIVVYDYMYNNSRKDEYHFIDGLFGIVAKINVEWWGNGFYHYTEEQLRSIVAGDISISMSFPIPAVKRKNDLGKLIIFEFPNV